jgi:hypothetical protein
MRKLFLLLILIFLAQVKTFGAIGVTVGGNVLSTSNAATYALSSFTPQTNSTVVVFAFATGTTATGSVTNTSGTSLTWHKKTSVAFDGGADTAYVFWANTGASTAASVYTLDFTGDNATACIGWALSFTGSDIVTPDPIKQFKTNSATSTNATVTFDTALGTNNGYAIGWGGQLSSTDPANVSTPPTSWTEAGDRGIGTPTNNATVAYRAGSETGTTYTFTNSSTSWGLVAIEVYVSGAGPSYMPRRTVIF